MENIEGIATKEGPAFDRWRFVPRMGVDIAGRDRSVEVLGRRWPVPFGVAPMALMRMADPEGEAPVEITLELQRERMQFNRNTCHVWAEDGPMFTQLERGEMIPPPKWGLERLEKLGLSLDDWYRRGGR